MKRLLRLSALFLLVLAFFGCSSTREDIPAPALADSISEIITSTLSGRAYQITVALPRGYAESIESYPVLYMVDANGQFGTMVETARQLRFEETVPEMIIVGIGYPVGRMWDAQAPRNIDLTPTADPNWVQQRAIDFPQYPAPAGSGGAPVFLDFIISELIPTVEQDYRVDSTNRAYYGHSFGGLFGVYALLHNQGIFQRFIIASPSLWWDDKVSFRLESDYSASRSDLPARVFFSMGALETHPMFDMVSNLEQFQSVLEARQYEDFEYTVRYFEEETHNTVISRSIVRGLSWIYSNGKESGV